MTRYKKNIHNDCDYPFPISMHTFIEITSLTYWIRINLRSVYCLRINFNQLIDIIHTNYYSTLLVNNRVAFFFNFIIYKSNTVRVITIIL